MDGETFDPQRDGSRLAVQLKAVRGIMADHQWHTLWSLSLVTSYPEASISARLRDLRKARYGSRTIERRYRGAGLWEYRMLKPGETP